MTKILLFVLFVPVLSYAQHIDDEIAKNVNTVMPKVIEWRRHFHQYPELSDREYNTGKYIAGYLKTLGLEVKYPVATTGVVAILKGGKPGPVIALRADMDGLPITERVDLPFKSVVKDTFNNQVVGVMHACGHDSHMAMLMGAATVLAKMKKDVPGTVVFLFQPAEEGAPKGVEAGAELMVDEGALDNPKVQAVFGLHIQSMTEVGKIIYRPGAFMASSDWFTVTVNGKGAHGAAPWSGIDPIVVSAQIIQSLQTIVSRQEDLTQAPVVITVGSIHAGNRSNIIPEKAVMQGTVRTLDNNMRKDVQERMKRTVQSIAESAGAKAEISFDGKTLVTYNDVELSDKVVPYLEAAAGKGNVSVTNWVTGAEDFSFYGEKAPSFFFFLGGMPKGENPLKAPGHHTPDFYIDESGFDIGVKAFCEIVMHDNDIVSR